MLLHAMVASRLHRGGQAALTHSCCDALLGRERGGRRRNGNLLTPLTLQWTWVCSWQWNEDGKPRLVEQWHMCGFGVQDSEATAVHVKRFWKSQLLHLGSRRPEEHACICSQSQQDDPTVVMIAIARPSFRFPGSVESVPSSLGGMRVRRSLTARTRVLLEATIPRSALSAGVPAKQRMRRQHVASVCCICACFLA